MQAIKNFFHGGNKDGAHADEHMHTQGAHAANEHMASGVDRGTDFNQSSAMTAPHCTLYESTHSKTCRANSACLAPCELYTTTHSKTCRSGERCMFYSQEHMTSGAAHNLEHHAGVRTIAQESVPVAVQKTYEQPITVETKQFVPVVMEKTLQQDAIARKVETVAATVERREWVALDQNAKPADVMQTTIQTSGPKEVSSTIHAATTGSLAGAAGNTETTTRRVDAGSYHEVDVRLSGAAAAGIDAHLLSSGARDAAAFTPGDINSMAHGGIVQQVLKSESVPISIERSYEKPVVIESKEYKPVVLEKTLHTDALVRKVETLPATIEKREWIQGADGANAKVVGVEEEILKQGQMHQIDSRVKSVGAAVTEPQDAAHKVREGTFHQVDAQVIVGNEREVGAGHMDRTTDRR